jgi:biopolymer transport protein ExbB/TolQ/biopolymer transport protein ExbD
MEIIHELGKCFLTSHEAFFFMWALAALGIVAVLTTVERWLSLNKLTDYDAQAFFDKIQAFLHEKKFDDAIALCAGSGSRALPRILGAGLRKYQVEPVLMTGAMNEESIHTTARLEKRLDLIMMFGNVSTLLGLLGTVFGLIMSFAAVGRPGVAAVEKSALLAAGISAAMNSTLVGLSISIPCVMVYSWLRTRVDISLKEIDRYAIATIKLLNPGTIKSNASSGFTRARDADEEPADLEVTPMLNLMVLLIPFLLSSSEFVRIGAIEMKLPEAAGGGGGGGGAEIKQAAKLDLGIVITAKGFNVFHYFKTENSAAPAAPGSAPDIPMKSGEYDYEALSKVLSEVKSKALLQIVRAYQPGVPESRTLFELASDMQRIGAVNPPVFEDYDCVKIVAEDKIQYKTVVEVMDAARGMRTDQGNVTMFPNVSIAGGIVQ